MPPPLESVLLFVIGPLKFSILRFVLNLNQVSWMAIISMLIRELLSSCFKESMFLFNDLMFVDSIFRLLLRGSSLLSLRLSIVSHVKSFG